MIREKTTPAHQKRAGPSQNAHHDETRTENPEEVNSSSEDHWTAMNHLMCACMAYLSLKLKHAERITRVSDHDAWEEWEDTEASWTDVMSAEWFDQFLCTHLSPTCRPPRSRGQA